MLTTASKLFLPLSALGLVLAVAYGVAGGDRAGTWLLLALVLTAAFVAAVLTTVRENEVADPVPADAGPPVTRQVRPGRLAGGAGWPILGAAGAALALSGLVLGPVAGGAGIALGLAALVGWLAAIASDHTGRRTDLLPIGLPVVGLFAIASLVFFMSRILLAVPEMASTLIALVVAVLILAAASVVALRPAVSSRALVTGLALAGVLMAGGGVLAAAAGHRPEKEEAHNRHAGPPSAEVVARNTAFVQKQLTFPANTEAVITLENRDSGVPHNLSVYNDPEVTSPLFAGEVVVGPSDVEYRFTTPPPGTYPFICDIHPNMRGDLRITDPTDHAPRLAPPPPGLAPTVVPPTSAPASVPPTSAAPPSGQSPAPPPGQGPSAGPPPAPGSP